MSVVDDGCEDRRVEKRDRLLGCGPMSGKEIMGSYPRICIFERILVT